MQKPVANILRRLAQMIVVDDTPMDEEEIQRRRMRLREDTGDVPVELSEGLSVVVSKPRVQVQREVIKPTARPDIKPTRRQHEHHKKWNETDKTDLMNDYMKQYRADGSDVGNRYVKKPKV